MCIIFNNQSIITEPPKYIVYRKNAICDNVGYLENGKSFVDCLVLCFAKNFKWIYHLIHPRFDEMLGDCGCCYDPPEETSYPELLSHPIHSGSYSNLFRLENGTHYH